MRSDTMQTRETTRGSQAGVTLMELLTVMVVIGILAAIAVPSYRSYLLRANRADAKSALLEVRVAQEKYFLQNNKYTDKVTDAPPTGLGMSGSTTHGYYAISIPTLGTGAQSYTAKATPIAGAGQTDDKKCDSFTLSDTGVRGITGTSPDSDSCWR
ncbi:MAG: type IV pilin protein [Gammaproteobacteria bacterium]